MGKSHEQRVCFPNLLWCDGIFAVLFACVQLGEKFYGAYGKKGSIVTNVSMTLAVIAAIATVNYILI